MNTPAPTSTTEQAPTGWRMWLFSCLFFGGLLCFAMGFGLSDGVLRTLARDEAVACVFGALLAANYLKSQSTR